MIIREIVDELKKNQKEYMLANITPQRILEEVKKNITNNLDIISEAYKLDTSNSELSKDKLLLQLQANKLEEADTFKNEYGKVTNLCVPYGVLGTVFDCNVYIALRLMTLSLATKNALIIDTTNNVGTIFMLVNEFNNVLKKFGLNNQIEIYHHNEGTNLEDVEELDGIIYIGKRANSERLKMSFDKPIIYSGCGNYELYIDNKLDDELVQKANVMGDIKIYSKKGIGIGQEVSGLEEAIARINESGSEYGVGIITESRENAKRFVNEIKARNVFVNALPTIIDNKLDITERDLVYKKSVLVYE